MGFFQSVRSSHPFAEFLGKYMKLDEGVYQIISTYNVSTKEDVWGEPWVGFKGHKPMPASELSVSNIVSSS